MYDPSYIRDFYDAYGHREWDREWEVAACREPGTLDGGTHIIAVIQRATGPC